MSRSLPLSLVTQTAATTPDTGADSVADPHAGEALQGHVAVFDPAMCCPTGLCGPGVDPALLTVSRDLRWLEKQGVRVTRTGLATAPDVFVSNPHLAALMRDHGDGALPATLVNDALIVHGRYPTRAELLTALSAAPDETSKTET